MTIVEEIEAAAKDLEKSQKGIADCTSLVFYTALKTMNPTELNAVGSIVTDALSDLMRLASDYLLEIKRINANEETDWENLQKNVTAYSSVIAYLKGLNEKLEMVHYFMDKRVPDCFRVPAKN